MEKWLYVIVGLTFIAGILGTAHHYYWIGVPRYWLPIGGFFSALEPLAFLGMAIYAYIGHAALRTRASQHAGAALDHRERRLLRAWRRACWAWPTPGRRSTSGRTARMITAMHGHMAFFGAYVMIVLAMITYALPGTLGARPGGAARSRSASGRSGCRSAGMFGMTMAFAAAGITQTYLERILGLGYLDDPAEDPGALPDADRPRRRCSRSASALFLYDFFFLAPRRELGADRLARRRAAEAQALSR